ncbi:DUF2147 domain-containing protein [Flavobacterium luteum]|uniref:DUF2147 domain-containing protein n=1 Tax=Flavobacterium luteum TaxID=2026654 RepID=A0A7J5AJ85_9FLAO|nr:DUF2147 domain-containing protein [Flavobacterium luteum]KAB1157682.1 DUF2147 domain-containing protein [Flavobacterium luteum]
MNKIQYHILLLLLPLVINAQVVTGKWKAIDDVTGKPLAILEIYEIEGKIYGKVLDILNPKDRHKVCSNCSGEDKDKPIIGMTVIKGLIKDGFEYNSGKILDPKHGRLYKCFITLESKDQLKVRGYIGFSLFGRTQYWYRVKSQ